MKQLPQNITIGLCIVALVCGIVACNERSHSMEKNVERMREEVTGKAIEADAVFRINGETNTMPMRWTDATPTNSPMCVSSNAP